MEFQRAKIIAGFALLSMWTKLWWGTRKLTRFLWALGPFVVRFIGVVIVILAVIFFVLDTKRDVAYRYSVPGSAACNTQADPKNRAVLVTVGNDELAAETSNHDIRANKAFTCMLQLHALKAGKGGLAPGNAALAYYLSFLEFRENGVPAQNGRDGALLERPQISVLLDHLNEQKKNGKQNFVFAFIHGWRHDARVGDKNVQNVRLMAAYLTSFLQQRCVNEHYKRYCNVTVTAVYIGWRGARLNETRIPTAALSDFLTTPTLFDRKPVSERIAPAVISALQKIDSTLHHQENAAPDSDAKSANWFKQPRLITIGHSLGGNLLATGLRDEMVDIIQRKSDFDKPEGEKAVVRSPLGDLIVLLNPASEAENWIALQRAFHRRIGADADTLAFQQAYSVRQPPIYISLTAAHYWPANGIQPSDVAALNKAVNENPKDAAKRKKYDPSGMIACTAIRIKNADYQPHYEYDTATYDLFPFFKFDFRPFAQTLDDWAEPDPFFCNEDTVRKEQAGAAPLNLIPAPPRPNIIAKWTWRGLAAILRNFPFMETNVVHTRTIGNLDPMRAPFGELFGDANDPATWYGTTHELLTNFKTRAGPGQNPYATILAQYADAASAEKSECAVVDGWLWTARSRGELTSTRGRVNWDSGYSIERNGKIVPPSDNDFNVTKIRPRPDDPTRHIESQVRQTLFFSGMRNIAGANDPFWNVRAFQSAMTNHNGYVSYPLICSIFQFVMDDITKENVAADLPR